jgi:hypothetical protein
MIDVFDPACEWLPPMDEGTIVPRAQKEEDQSAAGLLLRTYSAGPVVSDLLSRSKRPKAGNAL